LQEGLFRLRVGEQKINLVLDGTEKKVEVAGDLANLNQFVYDVKGSASSVVYRNVMQQLIARKWSADDVRNFVDTTANPLTAVLVSVQAVGGNPALMDVHQKAGKRLSDTFPGNSYVADYQEFIASVQKAAVNPGGNDFQFIDAAGRQPAPEIKLPNPSGKEYALSDLKGKVVLLDFWASWCRPCRMENPNVVRIYNKYKDQGFTVYSVSLDGIDSRQMAMFQNDSKKIKEALDQQKQRWKEAIQQDGLIWDYHVSDLKKWECAPARLYGVNSIPRTFMIDKDGKIAAVNLRGAEQIEQTLQKLL
jgi:thiol-disulfide isomerase/thioredoxin